MNLTMAQLQALKADLAANANTVLINGVATAISAVLQNSDTAFAVANWYNLTTVPDFWVWKPAVSKGELVQTTGPEGTVFNWVGNGFITRSAGEQTAWREIFNGTGTCDPSLPNVRQAFADIFSGTGNAAANRTHLLAVARKRATNAEKLFATGAGTPDTNAATMSPTARGLLTGTNVDAAWNLPS